MVRIYGIEKYLIDMQKAVKERSLLDSEFVILDQKGSPLTAFFLFCIKCFLSKHVQKVANRCTADCSNRIS